jgi:hypothetical protein
VFAAGDQDLAAQCRMRQGLAADRGDASYLAVMVGIGFCQDEI